MYVVIARAPFSGELRAVGPFQTISEVREAELSLVARGYRARWQELEPLTGVSSLADWELT